MDGDWMKVGFLFSSRKDMEREEKWGSFGIESSFEVFSLSWV